MAFLLSSKNALAYLAENGLCTEDDQVIAHVESKPAKNFNLLVRLPGERKLLVKQEPYDRSGKTAGEFLREWRIYQAMQQFPELSYLSAWLPNLLHFDADNSILVVDYLDNHPDLAAFYTEEATYPPAIAASIGAMLATMHRITLNQPAYPAFFVHDLEPDSSSHPMNIIKGLQRIGPEVFGQVPHDGLKFFTLYQRYDSLGSAIAELFAAFQPCCLTHNDLKLNNILVPQPWETAADAEPFSLGASTVSSAKHDQYVALKLIDWERSSWGDPAFDLGTVIASYLLIWLGSLTASKSIGIDEALRLAMTPLEALQPSNAALATAYFDQFPEILQHRPDFLQRSIQFAGFVLIQTILSMLQYQKSFGNTGICMLQVAKTLLCRPDQSVTTIFGVEAADLTRASHVPVNVSLGLG